MKRVISFSLWGNNPLYVIGALVNADIAKKHWEDWVCRYYVANSVPKEAIDNLKQRDNVEVVEMNRDESWNGMFWRFYPASESDVDVAIFRDADARLNIRDKVAVEEWLRSDKGVHIMRDNCQHGWTICGGMWGTKKGAIPNLKEMIGNNKLKETYNKHGIDQIFLQHEIYNNVVKDAFVHDDWFSGFTSEEKHPFPIPRLRGDGWWKQEFPEWHSGIEDDFEKYPWEAGHCFYKCPACGEYHDNEYIGKTQIPHGEEKNKYKTIIESCNV
jgi:protein O-GlcNAc transferase